jgi:hypothetical protein
MSDNPPNPSNKKSLLTVNIGSDLPTTASQKVSSARLPILTAPSPESNYLNWEFVVTSYFEAAGVNYILEYTDPVFRSVAWTTDNKAVCAVITQAIDSSNLCHIREHCRDAHKMWESLRHTHQDLTTRGQVFWIRKLLLAKMEGDDIVSHIDSLAKFHERLNSLVTPDNVHSAALLSSILPDWIHCVLALMNQEGVKTEAIVQALKNEHVCRQSQQDVVITSVSSTKAKPPTSTPSGNTAKKRHCRARPQQLQEHPTPPDRAQSQSKGLKCDFLPLWKARRASWSHLGGYFRGFIPHV